MRKRNVFLAGPAILLAAFTVAALIGCENGTTTVAPVEMSLSQLIENEGGVLFQNASRSVRLFDNGDFAIFNIGLFMSKQPDAAYGSKYKLDGNTIQVYRSSDAENAPFYTIAFTLRGHTLTIDGKGDGAGTAPDNTNLPLGKYSYGKLPFYRGN
jgi:hypothetical protein